VALFWSLAVLGFAISWGRSIAADVFHRQVSAISAWGDFNSKLFEPGENLFMVGVLHAIPFEILSVVLLFHLSGSAIPDDTFKARLSGILGGAILLIALSFLLVLLQFFNPATLGGVAFIVFPVVGLAATAVGYFYRKSADG
jgi:hypothetical protein